MKAMRVSQPSFSNQSCDLAGAFLLRAGAAAADQHHAVLDDVEVAALEGACRDHVVDRNAELLIGADGRIVLAAPPPVGHGGDDGAIGRHDAGIAGIDLHRQFRRRLVPVDVDAEMLVGGDQVLVLRLGDLDVAGRLAQMFARQRTGRQMTQEIRRAEKHVGQHVGLVGEAPRRQRLGAAGRVAALERERFVRQCGHERSWGSPGVRLVIIDCLVSTSPVRAAW